MTSPRRSTLAALLAGAMGSGTLVIPVLSVLATFLIGEFGLTRSQLGWLVTAFAGVGALASPLAGRLTDALGGRLSLVATFGVAGLTALGMAAAPSYAWVALAVLVGGLANAASNPATNKLISLHVAPGQRGLITGIKQSGVQMAYFLGGLLLPVGAVSLGWRPTVALAGLLPLGAVGLALRLVAPDPVTPSSGESPEGSYRHDPAIRWLAVYGFLMGAGGAAIISYLPLYATEGVGLSVTTAGLVAGLSGLAGVAGRILWSHRSEGVAHFSTPLALMALVSVGATVALWTAPRGGDWLLWTGALAAGATAYAWNAVGMLAVVAEADTRHTGRASGAVLFGFLTGYTVSPVIFGYTVDWTGGYGPGWAGTTAVFLAALGTALLWRRSGRTEVGTAS